MLVSKRNRFEGFRCKTIHRNIEGSCLAIFVQFVLPSSLSLSQAHTLSLPPLCSPSPTFAVIHFRKKIVAKKKFSTVFQILSRFSISSKMQQRWSIKRRYKVDEKLTKRRRKNDEKTTKRRRKVDTS